MAPRRTPPGDASVDAVRVRMLPDGRMDRHNAARYLGRAPKTLAQWKTNGKGPPGKKVGGRVFYYREDLDAFIASEMRSGTEFDE